MTRMSITVAATGTMCGQVISRKICQPPAPSTWPASTRSRGTFSSAASMTTKMKGIHCQESPTMMNARAVQGFTAHAKSPRPNHCQTGANGPLPVSAIMRKVKPMPMGVTMRGRKNTTRKNVRPRMGCEQRNASPRPMRNWMPQPTMT